MVTHLTRATCRPRTPADVLSAEAVAAWMTSLGAQHNLAAIRPQLQPPIPHLEAPVAGWRCPKPLCTYTWVDANRPGRPSNNTRGFRKHLRQHHSGSPSPTAVSPNPAWPTSSRSSSAAQDSIGAPSDTGKDSSSDGDSDRDSNSASDNDSDRTDSDDDRANSDRDERADSSSDHGSSDHGTNRTYSESSTAFTPPSGAPVACAIQQLRPHRHGDLPWFEVACVRPNPPRTPQQAEASHQATAWFEAQAAVLDAERRSPSAVPAPPLSLGKCTQPVTH